MRVPMVALAAAALLLTGCGVDRDADRDAQQAQQPAPPSQPAPLPPEQQLELEVDIAARELYVYRGGQRVATHPVAVGSEEWPTPTGEWTIGQVVWNPRWVPPDQEWAEGEEPKEPGDPENPLGRAQLVYSPPNSIHGTIAPESLGRAVSHGSIRVSNEVAMELAREVMEAGGAGRDEDWYRRVRENRTQHEIVSIPNPVPIRVVAGSAR
jgi:lipoprotein-anchoring transpeptidase ErfK/SrfK